MYSVTTEALPLTDAFPYERKVTYYGDDAVPTRALLIYCHGGGLLYGEREDLPELHLKTFTEAGFRIAAIDYPMAPTIKLDDILEAVLDAVREVTEENRDLPYFLFGRSAGAYLMLLAAASGKLPHKPSGILSYYGYGFLTDQWFETPSAYYMQFPAVPESCLPDEDEAPFCDAPLDSYYDRYIYARQQGRWKGLIYEGRDKYFYRDYTLRLADSLGAPLFAAHSTGDTDVPYEEFRALQDKYHPETMIAVAPLHDFDRDTEDPFTAKLLEKSVAFLNEHLD